MRRAQNELSAADRVISLVLEKPEAVQIVIRMFAVKSRLTESMETDEEFARAVQAGIDMWDEVFANALKIYPAMTDVQFADALIERVRAEQPRGWGRILRGDAS